MTENGSAGQYEGGRNPEVELQLRLLARTLKEQCPLNWGFSLFMFEFNNADGSSFYISSADRADFLRSLELFMRRNGYIVTPPA